MAAFAGRAREDFVQTLVIEYQPGAAIGWHKDRPRFEITSGVSLLTSCPFRFRRRVGERFERAPSAQRPVRSI